MSRLNERTVRASAASRPKSGRLSWPAALLALACAVAGSALALHYPLSAPWAMALFALAAVAAWLSPQAWLVALPALLPIIGFAPWTGWITFEEFDLLVLAAAAGGYARRAWRTPAVGDSRASRRPPGNSAAALIGLTIALLAASTLLAMARGFADAGGFSFGWFQGYREPMNSLRLAKPLFAALLLWPLWTQASRDAPDQAAERLSLGMMLGLLGASLAALWERLAFTDLLNFSSDYRTTALFWEMHVGGAALDGFLALTMPFAVREMLVAPSKVRWAFAAGVTALATYACITTFSRGVYLAVPIGVALMAWLHSAQRRRDPGRNHAHSGGAWPRVLWVCAFAVAAAWMFPGSGYRGMLALAGAVAVLLPLGEGLRRCSRAQALAGVSLGLVLALLAGAAAWWSPKGPYLAYAFAVLATLAVLALQRRATHGIAARHGTPMTLAGYIWVLSAVGLVALHWGGAPALWQALPVIAALLLAAWLAARSRHSAWPADLRWQGNTVGAMVVAGGLVAVFAGGAYMGSRFSSGSADLDGRLQHWQLSLSVLDGPSQWLLGKGAGRYPESYAIAAPEATRPGDYRLREDDGTRRLRLVAGATLPTAGVASPGGDMLRLSQRIDLPSGLPMLELRLRAAEPTKLVAGVCTKHLLYAAECIGKEFGVKPAGGDVQTLQSPLQGDALTRGAWYAPRLVVFAIGIDNPQGSVDIEHIALRDADGRDLLANGGFDRELAHWFFTSDRSHLPWHAKNLPLHLLFEHGLLGLVLWCALVAGALWRLSFGSARGHALAPVLAAAIAGFATVGLFDSLLDVPRVAFVFYLLLLAALGLRSAPAVAPSDADRQRARSAPAVS